MISQTDDTPTDRRLRLPLRHQYREAGGRGNRCSVRPKLPDVVLARDYKFMCSDPGQELIQKDIEEHKLDRVVVASCSPLMHEPTFRKACEDGGLQTLSVSRWPTSASMSLGHRDKEAATEKAKALVAAAVDRVVSHEPLAKQRVPVGDKVSSSAAASPAFTPP